MHKMTLEQLMPEKNKAIHDQKDTEANLEGAPSGPNMR